MSSKSSIKRAKRRDAFVQAQQANQSLTHTATFSATSHRGPLPDPATLGKYDQFVGPGTADRIIKMAESQQVHVHAMDREMIETGKDAIRKNHELRHYGQWASLAIAVLATISATIAGLHGADWKIVTAIASGGAATTAISAISDALTRRKKSESDEPGTALEPRK